MQLLKIIGIGIIALLTIGGTGQARADQYADTITLFKKSPAVQPFFENAFGYAVFPAVGKGGIGIGGAYGRGQVYRQDEATGSVSLMKLSAGFQFGGQAFSEIIFFQNQSAYEKFTAGRFEFDATASAVAVTAGAQAQVGTGGNTAGVTVWPDAGQQQPTRYNRGMAVFIHTIGGLMYEAAIGGQQFIFTPTR